MNLDDCINKLNQLFYGKKIDPQLEARMKAIQAEFAAMSDEELRAIVEEAAPKAIASEESSEEFKNMTNWELLELIARSESCSQNQSTG